MSVDTILEQVNTFAVQHVTVTGGEPLAQKACPVLLEKLCDAGYAVSLETSGALDISQLDERVTRVMDIKTPDSGEVEKNLWQNIECLSSKDQVKFVICSREDYDWAKEIVAQYRLAERCEVLFSPVFGELSPRDLADWVVSERLPVRFQLQLHKILWGEEQGR